MKQREPEEQKLAREEMSFRKFCRFSRCFREFTNFLQLPNVLVMFSLCPLSVLAWKQLVKERTTEMEKPLGLVRDDKNAPGSQLYNDTITLGRHGTTGWRHLTGSEQYGTISLCGGVK